MHRPCSRLLSVAALLGLGLAAAPALADPAPGRVQVVSDAGVLVGGELTGVDALQNAVARVRTGPLARADDSRRWSILLGAGTYGDAAVNEPNLTIRPSAGAVVVVSGTGSRNDTGGECLDITAGGVVVEDLVCRAPADRGFEVNPPASARGIVLRRVSVDRARSDGIAVLGGADVLLENVQVTSSGRDGIRLNKLTGPGPYRIQGGAVRLSGDDGVDLADDVARAQIVGTLIEASRSDGVESDDAGSSDLLVQDAQIVRNSGRGLLLGGGGLRLAVQGGVVRGSGRAGIEIGKGAGFSVRGVSLDGSNRDGDLRLSPDIRAGSSYQAIDFGGSGLDLPGEPRGVALLAASSTVRAGLSPLPDGLADPGRLVRVKDTGRASSQITLRFILSPDDAAAFRLAQASVWEDDPPGNGRRWQQVPGGSTDPGARTVTASLSDSRIASGSDSRYATYAALAPRNGAPEILSVFPAPGATMSGRTVVVSAAVRDDTPLSTGSFLLEVDGVRRGGPALRNGVVRFIVRDLAPGTRSARLTVVDQSGLRASRSWSFGVGNGRPTIVRRLALPRPGRTLAAGRRTFLIPVRDDRGWRTLQALVVVNGTRVPSRIRAGRIIATPVLRPGGARVTVRVTDADGARRTLSWAYRVRR